jgi:hypothetical protein
MDADAGDPTARAGEDPESARAALHRPFRPRRSRIAASVLGLAQLAVLAGVAIAGPSGGERPFRWYDRAGLLTVGLAIGWLLLRFARLEAVPSDGRLRVRNLLITRELPWTTIQRVRFGGGEPWVLLGLSDGEEVAVMAVQRADGSYGDEQARRLATLVALHATDRSGGGPAS